MKKRFSSDIIKIFSKAAEEKIYGSVEVYFEAGNITQITQRIINKVYHSNSKLKKIETTSQKDSQLKFTT